MKICAIVPMCGFPEMTKKCIDYTFKNAGVDCEILVVDDGSPEPFQDARVSVLRLEKNSGFTNATNQGILWCKDRFDYVLLLNNDTEPEPDFIKYLLEALEKDSEIGIAGSSRIIYQEGGKPLIENFGVDLISGYQAYTTTDLDKEIVYVAWLPVCSALIPMEIIRYVGLLDKNMKTFCSDNDYCIRVQQLGYRIALVPKSKVKHFHMHTVKHMKIEGSQDQLVLLGKLACRLQTQLLETYPLDYEQNTWGKLDFTIHTNGKLNQSATAKLA